MNVIVIAGTKSSHTFHILEIPHRRRLGAQSSYGGAENTKVILFSFQTSQVSARSVEVTGESVSTSPNVEAVLEDFRIMGKDLVKSVETRTEQWAF